MSWQDDYRRYDEQMGKLDTSTNGLEIASAFVLLAVRLALFLAVCIGIYWVCKQVVG